MVKSKIIDSLKSFWVKTISFFKFNKLSFVLILSFLFCCGSAVTLFEQDYGYQYFSSSIEKENSFYQISIDINEDNFNDSKVCVQQYKNTLGMAFYSMNVYHSPMSYLFVDAKNNAEDGLTIESEVLSIVNFPVFSIETITENEIEHYTVGGTDVNLMYSTNASGNDSSNAIYISNLFADKLISKGVASDYDELLGETLSTSGTNASFLPSIHIANIFQIEEGGSEKLYNFFNDFIISSRLLYASVPCSKMKAGALIDKKEFSNKIMLETFSSFFAEKKDFSIKIGSEEGYDQKYSKMINDAIKQKIDLKIGHIIVSSISCISLSALLIFSFKVKKMKELFPSNLLVTFFSLVLVLLVFSIIKLISGFLLFGYSGIIFILIGSISLPFLFQIFRKNLDVNT